MPNVERYSALLVTFVSHLLEMHLSYWEHTTWLKDIDYAIVGSGIVGLSCALELREKHPRAKIVVFEKGMLPSGASTKNAGFACFGSISEILDDLKTHSEAEVLQLVKDRVSGLELLRKTVGDAAMEYREYGGYELFRTEDAELYETCLSRINEVNDLLREVFASDVFSAKENPFGFLNIQKQLVYNTFEGQINTGAMMKGLLSKTSEADILVLNSAEITSYSETSSGVAIQVNNLVDTNVRNLLIATNGFGRELVSEEVAPARAQVLITKPLHKLPFEGTFHLEKGFYYCRNVGSRVLFGGGRNLDFKTEETTETGLTPLVQNTLEELLRTTILPDTAFEIESRWSGIMGVGPQKKPIVRQVSDRVFCGIRLGGMGVAIGSSIGRQLADLV